MQKIKSEKGITLIVLVITIIVLALINIPVLVNIDSVIEFNRYTDFKDDIDTLRESIDVAYHNKDIQSIGPKYDGSLDFLNGQQNGLTIRNANDNDNYYIIDISAVNSNLSARMRDLNLRF